MLEVILIVVALAFVGTAALVGSVDFAHTHNKVCSKTEPSYICDPHNLQPVYRDGDGALDDKERR